jgi:hypothetical protein
MDITGLYLPHTSQDMKYYLFMYVGHVYINNVHEY